MPSAPQEFLRRALSYPDKPAQVVCIETHISWVFLTDRHAWKLKKPVQFDFLDYSTPAARLAACQQELRLNSRLAEGVYLEVVPITADKHGELRLGGEGELVDAVVKMRRLPDEATLEALLRAERLEPAQAKALADRLNRFYRTLPATKLPADEYRQTFARHVRGNQQALLDPAHRFDRAIVRQIGDAQLRLLELAPSLLAERAQQGRIVEGHGDLRPEHVYFLPEPAMIDCIEFSREFRTLDIVDELSFLAMECEQLGAPAVGQQLLSAYVAETGDRPPASLLSFYKCYRACVRAKVLAIRSQQLAGKEQAEKRAQAWEYLRGAERHAAALGPPALIVVRGLSGSGKSTLARLVAEPLGAEHLATDALRQRLFARLPQPAAYGAGDYRPERRAQVYEEMFRQADRLLAEGASVVLDGTFLKSSQREQAVAVARRRGAPILLVRCRCPADVIQARIAQRLAAGEDDSQARPEFHQQQAAAEEHQEPAGAPCCEVDTTADPTTTRDQVLARLRQLYAPLIAADRQPV